MTTNPSRFQKSSSAGRSGAAATMKAQNFAPNMRWIRRYRHHRAGMESPGGGLVATGSARRTCALSTSRIFGTHTITEMRRSRTERTMWCGW